MNVNVNVNVDVDGRQRTGVKAKQAGPPTASRPAAELQLFNSFNYFSSAAFFCSTLARALSSSASPFSLAR